MQQLEQASEKMMSSGRCAQWMAARDDVMAGVSAPVNGALFHELLAASGHCDLGCAELFHKGV